MKYFSQINQDQYFIEQISNYKKNGFFLDIGANDGIHSSNTASLEFYYGWKGICIEANPALIKNLEENRPNSIIVNSATWNQDTIINFELTDSNLNNIEGHLLSRIANMERNEKYFKDHFAENKKIIDVQAKKVTTIFQEINMLPCTIDYASIDTEGAELETLEGIDFSKIDIKFMTVEFGGRKKYLRQITNYLLNFGYSLHRINQWDAEFVK
jgi:FkbM family methyltransferase